MSPNKYPGKFITFEGLDGAGLSTQSKKLANFLKKQGRRAYLTKEPSRGVLGRLIRRRLKGEWYLEPKGLQLLFAADRAYHLEQEVIPNLKQGKIVISDRYFLSTLAFGYLEIKDKGWLEKINDLFILPDLTFLLCVSPSECLKRILKGRDSFELFEEKKKLKKVYQAYLSLSKKFKNIYKINGGQNKEKVFEDIKNFILKFLN